MSQSWHVAQGQSSHKIHDTKAVTGRAKEGILLVKKRVFGCVTNEGVNFLEGIENLRRSCVNLDFRVIEREFLHFMGLEKL